MYPQDILGYSPSLWVLVVTLILCGPLQYSLLKKITAPPWRLGAYYILLISAGIVGGKLMSLSTRDWQLYEPLIREVNSGWRYAGVLAAFILTMPLIQRWILPGVSLGRLADIMALSVALGVAVFRAHCFLLGCCTGHQWEHGLAYARGSNVWWNQYNAGLIDYSAAQSLPVIPLHLLFMAASLTTFGILLRLYRKGLPAGHLTLWFLLIHEGTKAGLELLRPFQINLFSVSAIAAIGAAIMLCYLHNSKANWYNTPFGTD